MLKGCMHAQSLSHVQLFVTPLTVAHQAPLSTEFSRQEYWSRLPFPSLEDLTNPGIEPTSLAYPVLAGRFFTTELPEKRVCVGYWLLRPECYSLTLLASSPSVLSLCPAECHFLGNRDENKMLSDLKKPQGSMRYRWKLQSMPQMIPFILILVKHVT